VPATGNTTGSSNTFIGAFTGTQNTTASYNTFVGYLAGNYNTTGSNDIYIGAAGPSSGTESNTIRLGGGVEGGSQTSAYIVGIYGVNAGGIPVTINANGQLGAPTSSLRFKEQVHDMGDSTSGLMKLRPVTFVYKPEYADGEPMLQYGLIAEEVAKIYPELVAYDNDGQPYAVRYQYLNTMLLNEAQKQYRRAEAQEQKIERLEERLSRLEVLLRSQAQLLSQK
jgi:trimeric autotransporter adhesin